MPHSTTEKEETEISLPTTDSEADVEGEEWTEEQWTRLQSTTYTRGLNKPMKEPLTESWGLPISDADVEKLKVGFKSRDMEDRWDFLIEDPDEHGNISFHIIRSWLQEDCYIFYVVPKPNNEDGGSAIIQSITWEGNKSGRRCDAEQAKKEAVMLYRGRLKCDFETLPEYPSWVFWDSNAYTRIDAE